jgi:hypothetical protein
MAEMKLYTIEAVKYIIFLYFSKFRSFPEIQGGEQKPGPCPIPLHK